MNILNIGTLYLVLCIRSRKAIYWPCSGRGWGHDCDELAPFAGTLSIASHCPFRSCNIASSLRTACRMSAKKYSCSSSVVMTVRVHSALCRTLWSCWLVVTSQGCGEDTLLPHSCAIHLWVHLLTSTRGEHCKGLRAKGKQQKADVSPSVSDLV